MLNLRQKILVHAQRNYLDLQLPQPISTLMQRLENRLYNRSVQHVVIEKPIFIVGCHRSGTTVLYETLAQHPDLVYFTNASSLLPHTPILTNQVINLFGEIKQKVERFSQDELQISHKTPSEGIRIWELYASVNNDYCLDETYNNPEMDDYLKLIIKKHLKYFQGQRFINKNPDNSVRIRYLNKLFPDAYFIHIVRDGRAVCYSLLKFRKAAAEFFGSDHRHATSGVKVKVWREIAEYWQTDPVLSAGLLWREVLETIERDRAFISPDRYLELRYEDFVEQPLSTLQHISQFCQLPWNETIQSIFTQATNHLSLQDRNDRWKQQLKREEIERLKAVIAPKMQDYGYSLTT
jgi:hypothetical protein